VANMHAAKALASAAAEMQGNRIIIGPCVRVNNEAAVRLDILENGSKPTPNESS